MKNTKENQNNKKTLPVIAICGMAGAGKTTIQEFFTSKGFVNIHLGVTELAIEKYGYTNEEIESELRVKVREEHGMGAMAAIVMPKLLDLRKEKKTIVIDNMYSWSEYKIFKEAFGSDFYTIAVHASPATRYQRLASRKDGRDYREPEVSKSRDYSEIEGVEKGGPIAMADIHIVNENLTVKLLLEKVDEFFAKSNF